MFLAREEPGKPIVTLEAIHGECLGCLGFIGDDKVRLVGLWDPFQMAFPWLINGGY